MPLLRYVSDVLARMNFRRTREFAAWLTLAMLAGCSDQRDGIDIPTPAPPDPRIAALEETMGGAVPGSLAERMAQWDTPGVQIAVIHEGKLAWNRAYGLDNIESERALTVDTPMQVGSISKPTTALAILMLAASGALDLDTPVNNLLESWQVDDQPPLLAAGVTPRRVLSHAAGLGVPSYIGYSRDAAIPSLVQVLDGAAPATSNAVTLELAPGQAWRYSGGAYTSLAVLLQDITGDTFTDWVRQQIFEPAGMTLSSFEQPSMTPGAYDNGRVSVLGNAAPPLVYPELPAAGMWSTAGDLAQLVMEIHKGLQGGEDALFREAATWLVTPQPLSPPPLAFGLAIQPGMGLGMALNTNTEPGWFWHPGSNFGYTALVVGDVKAQGYGAAVITNAFPGGSQLAIEIVNAVADLYAWPEWEDYGLFGVPD